MNLNQITIKSKDVNTTVAFYLKLGLRLIVDSSPRYVRFECPKGDSTLSVSHAEPVSHTETAESLSAEYVSTSAASTTLYFEVDDIDHEYELIKTRGVNFTSQPENKSWLWREAGLADPDGRSLILFTAGKNRKNPPWRVKKKRWFEYYADASVNLMK